MQDTRQRVQLEALKLSLKEWKLVQGLRPLLERATSFATIMEADKHASPSSLIEHLHLLKAELTPRSQASPGNVKTGVEPTAGALIRDVETMFDPAYSLPRCEGATPYVLHRSQCCCGHANAAVATPGSMSTPPSRKPTPLSSARWQSDSARFST